MAQTRAKVTERWLAEVVNFGGSMAQVGGKVLHLFSFI